jgi:hypothetical protein
MANTSDVHDQHTTPRFYLSGFRYPKEPAYIWEYERGKPFLPGKPGQRHNPVKRTLKKAGVMLDYYYDIEDELKTIEDAAKAIIEKIRTATAATVGPVISLVEKREFVTYVGNLHKRVTKREQRVAPVWPKLVEEFPWDAAQRELAYAGLFRAAIKIVEVRQQFDRGMPERARQASILMPYDRTATKLYEMTWRVLIATPPDAFITTDNPVYIGSESFFVPIATHIAILGQMSGPDDCTIHPINTGGVQQCNRVLIAEAVKYVYSHEPNEWVADTFNGT